MNIAKTGFNRLAGLAGAVLLALLLSGCASPVRYVHVPSPIPPNWPDRGNATLAARVRPAAILRNTPQ